MPPYFWPIEEAEPSAQKKTAQAIQQEAAREVEQLLGVIFQGRRPRRRVDLEAIETAIRSAMYQAGAAALTQLLQFDPSEPERRTVACSCGHAAQYTELRTKTILSVLGPVQVRRHCCPN